MPGLDEGAVVGGPGVAERDPELVSVAVDVFVCEQHEREAEVPAL